MLNILVELIARRPELLLEHALGYVELVQQEARRARRAWLLKVVAAVCTVSLAIVTLTLLGVVAILCSAGLMPWSLPSFQVVGIALALTSCAAVWAWRCFRIASSGELGTQVQADVAGFRKLWGDA